MAQNSSQLSALHCFVLKLFLTYAGYIL